MKLKPWHWVILVVLGYAMCSGPEISENNQAAAIRREEAAQNSALRRQRRDSAREREQRSADAVKRYMANCVPVVALDSGKDAMHLEGQEVIDRSTGQRLAPGTLVCNQRGWTAVLDQQGLISDVAIAAHFDRNKDGESDLQEIRGILNGG